MDQTNKVPSLEEVQMINPFEKNSYQFMNNYLAAVDWETPVYPE